MSPNCTFCQVEKETMDHLFFTCKIIQELWYTLERIIEYYFHVKLTLTKTNIFFNNYRGQEQDIINWLIIVMKQYIYSTKCRMEYPSFTQYMTKLSYWYLIDKQQAVDAKQLKEFQRKWKTLF